MIALLNYGGVGCGKIRFQSAASPPSEIAIANHVRSFSASESVDSTSIELRHLANLFNWDLGTVSVRGGVFDYLERRQPVSSIRFLTQAGVCHRQTKPLRGHQRRGSRSSFSASESVDSTSIEL